MEKTCSQCGVVKPLDCFDKQKGGKHGVRAACKPCIKTYMSDYSKRNRKRISARNLERRRKGKQMVYDHLKSNPCVDCGETRIPALQFDHVSDDKEYNISGMIQRSFNLDTIRREMAKCEVRCANCHAVRTATQYNWYSGLER